ncbi:FAD/NAD(P)-binding protein [Sinisalibacter aestuarii]|uniref:Oxidoreductase n=1 Tax=Sinisalibacter aestuarii TaxID=2949426 RepID=A0ABQ5LT85_9RHOB|nr:FAD/NAD(P)-binding protein [Sinisalibacter aestuarii]GKY87307.1 oxidoreductase [Sinisalibacter aestuarii]
MLAPDLHTDPMVPVLARVTRRIHELSDIVTFEMEVDGWQGFAPGQFNMLSVFGVGEVPISISGPLSDRSKIIHTIRDVGPVSHALCALRKGAVLGLRGPYGAPWPVEAARGRDVVVVAGGLGLAPVRPILYELIENRDRYGKVTLLYGARSPREILFAEELGQWRSRLDLGVEVSVDRGDEHWHGHVGVVTGLLRAADFDPANTTAFVCGPEIMMRFAANGLVEAGMAATDIHLSMERNMQCGIGLCGHCQLGPVFVCKDGPVFDWAFLKPLMAVKEL